MPTGAKKENGPRLRLGQASNPSRLAVTAKPSSIYRRGRTIFRIRYSVPANTAGSRFAFR